MSPWMLPAALPTTFPLLTLGGLVVLEAAACSCASVLIWVISCLASCLHESILSCGLRCPGESKPGVCAASVDLTANGRFGAKFGASSAVLNE